MKKRLGFDSVYEKSENVVARDVQGEFIIIPITSGISETEDEIFSLNETGRAIWEKMDGEKSLKDIAKILSSEYNEDAGKIEKDVLGITGELFKRKMLVEVK